MGKKKMASIPGIVIISTLILGLMPGSYAADAQEVPSTVQNMALVTTQFDGISHNKYLFDPEKADSSFRAFYDLNSHGKMTWNVTITPTWYTLPKPFIYYDVTCRLDRGNYFASTYDFITDALRAASTDLDLTKFNYVMIIYPRYDSALDHSCTLPSRSWIVDDKEYHFGISIVRESASYSWLNDNLWVMEREAGRFLGLPYLYGPNEGEIPAAWDVMGWAGGSHNSTLLGGWSKTKLGWIDEKNVKTIGYGEHETVTLDALGNKPSGISVVKLPITTDRYYMLEARLRVGADASLPNDVSPGVVISEVDEKLETGKVTWISNPTPDAPSSPKEIKDIAFLEGDKFLNGFVNSVQIVSKTQDSFVIEVDRASLYPRIIEGYYDHDGIRFAMPEGWKYSVIGWDIFAAKDNPLIAFGKLKGMAMSMRIVDPKVGLEDHSSNPLFSDVECKPISQTYLELNNLVAKEVMLRCLPPAGSIEFAAPVAKTYYFGQSHQQQGSATYANRLLSLTLAADSPMLYEAYLPEFEKAVNSVQVRDTKDVRIIESETFGLREQVQKVEISNSTLEIPLSTNSQISDFKFDPDQHTIAFKINSKDSDGRTLVPYDTFFSGPYWVRVDGKTDTSFLVLEDKISGDKFAQISHHTGVNDIQITGMPKITVTSPQNAPSLPENEKPVEIKFRPPPPEQSNRHPPIWWKWAEAASISD